MGELNHEDEIPFDTNNITRSIKKLNNIRYQLKYWESMLKDIYDKTLEYEKHEGKISEYGSHGDEVPGKDHLIEKYKEIEDLYKQIVEHIPNRLEFFFFGLNLF